MNEQYDRLEEQNAVSKKGKKKGLGIASMVCGILAMLLLCPLVPFIALLGLAPLLFGLVALALGIVQIVKNEDKGMAIAGIVCGAVGALLGAAEFVFYLWAVTGSISSYGGI